MKLTLYLSILCFVNYVYGASPRVDPLVRIEQGLVRGQKATDGDYSTFLGIPYAQVDLENPFGPAQPPTHFKDVFNAYDASIKCLQSSKNDGNDGTLDCLTLNIYVPDKASSKNPLSVLVFIHGGGFAHRYAGDFHPVNLVKHDVIVVTINYRLGPYGFICLDLPSVSGNQGLKDQYEALNWVRNNIADFGGNPYEITLAGESAGSASVLYHLYSSKDKLYNKIIIQSDTPQSVDMFAEKDVRSVTKLAGYLGFNTSEIEQALDFLSKTSPDLVIAASNNLNLVFKPCKEEPFSDVEGIINTVPSLLANERKVRGTPVLIGHTTREHKGVLLEIYGDNYLKDDPFYNKLNDSFDLNEEELVQAANTVRHFYIGDEPLSSELLSVLEDFDSDFVFNHPVQRTVNNLLKEDAKPYQYLFTYVGDSDETETGHAAENSFLFYDVDVPHNDDDQLMIDRITTLWTNFVKFGNPTPEVTDLLPVIWEPTAKDTRPYLVIDTDIRLENRIFKERMAFWDLFYSVYGKYRKQ